MQGMREGVTCAVCSEVYQEGIREPLMLPCGHSFCRTCLDGVKRSGNFLCPTCRKSHNNIQGDQLSVNYSLLSVSSACHDIEFDTCGVHGDDRKYWCCDCEQPLCSLCLYSGHPQGHSVKLTKAYIQEKKMVLKIRLKVFDKKIENQMEEVRNKLAELLQGVQGLCPSSSDLHVTWMDMTRILEQVEKASSIECIKLSEKSVNQFIDKWTNYEKVAKEEKTSKPKELEEESNTAGATAAKNAKQIPIVRQEGAVSRSRLDFEEGRLVLHCFGPSADARLFLKMPSEVFLELSAGGSCLGRVYIHLWINLRRAQQFLALCMGTLGVSYRGAASSEVRNKGRPGEFLYFPNRQSSGQGNTYQPLFTGLDQGTNIVKKIVEGLVGQHENNNHNNSGFKICTIGSPGTNLAHSFGEVSSGLEVVKAAVSHPPNTITISNCGLVLPDSLI